MEALHTKLIVDKQTRRHVTILSMFSDSDSDALLNIKDIASILNVTTKTVYKDLDDLVAKYPHSISFNIHSNSMIEVMYSNGFCPEDFLREQVGFSLLYRLLDGLFRGVKISSCDWAVRFFVSESTFRKYVAYLNEQVLNDYGLSVSQHCLRLEGNEREIRMFFFRLFFGYKNQLHTLTVDKRFFDIIHDMKRRDETSFSDLYIDNYRCAGWFMIGIQRSLLRCDLCLGQKLVSEITAQPQFEVFKDSLNKAMQKVYTYFTLPEHEVMYLYLVILHAVVYGGNDDEASSVSNFTRLPYKHYDVFEKFVATTLQKIYSNDQTFEVAVSRHCALLCNLSQLTKLSVSFQTVSNDVKTYVLNFHNELYLEWLHALKEHDNYKQLRFKYLEDVAISLSVLTMAFAYQYNVVYEHVVLCFTGCASHVSLLTTICKTLIPTNVMVTVKFDEVINQSYIVENKVDLLVTNYDLGKNIDCQIYRMPHLPSMVECAKLKSVLMSTIQ